MLSVVQRNGYYAHPENILAAKTTVDNLDIRRLAWRRIKICRNSKKKNSNKGQKSHIPKLNLSGLLYDNIFIEINETPHHQKYFI